MPADVAARADGGPEPVVTGPADDGDGGGSKKGPWAGVASFLLELPVLVLIAFVLALVLKTFVVQAFFIPSTSMLPTLQVEDRVLVNKVVYQVRDPRRGEVIVFAPEGTELTSAAPDAGPLGRFMDWLSTGLGMSAPHDQDFIKRILGLPGETIEVRGGVVLIDGLEVPEFSSADGGYLTARDTSDFGPLELGPDEYFMMGDNRGSSLDSRSDLGTIARDEIVGRAFVIIWPPSNFTSLSRPDYPPELSAIDARLVSGARGAVTSVV